MKNVKILIIGILLISPIIFINSISVSAQDEEPEEPLEVELTVTEKVPLINYSEEQTVGLRFTQRGFNWTDLSERLGFFTTKILWPLVMFRNIKHLLGYNSVVFEAEILGNPTGWQAWVSPSSVAKFTGDQSVDLKLHIKATRPTSVNTAVIRVKFTAYGGDNAIMGKSYSEVVASIRPYHLADIRPVKDVNIAPPNTVAYLPLEITNLGNYEDTFAFRINEMDKDLLAEVSGQLTLMPGESGQINLMVLTPDTYIYDFGTGRNVNISAYSVLDSSKTFPTEIQVLTRGFFLSELFVFTIVLIVIIIIIFYSIYSNSKKYPFKRKKGKKEKPKKEEKKETKKKKNLFSGLLKKSKEKKEKPKKEIIEEPIEPIKPEPRVEEKKEKIIDLGPVEFKTRDFMDKSKLEKEKAMARVKKRQEKQKKKLK